MANVRPLWQRERDGIRTQTHSRAQHTNEVPYSASFRLGFFLFIFVCSLFVLYNTMFGCMSSARSLSLPLLDPGGHVASSLSNRSRAIAAQKSIHFIAATACERVCASGMALLVEARKDDELRYIVNTPFERGQSMKRAIECNVQPAFSLTFLLRLMLTMEFVSNAVIKAFNSLSARRMALANYSFDFDFGMKQSPVARNS